MYNKFPDMLIGMQLVDISETEMTVKNKDGETIQFVFDDSDCGGCCGYNNFRTTLNIPKGDLKNAPIITNVETEENEDYSHNMIITFFGESKKLARIESDSGSGSGWCYGACVKVRCRSLGIEEILTQW